MRRIRSLAAALAVATLGLAAPPAWAGKSTDTLIWATDRENPIADGTFLNTRENVIMGHMLFDRPLYFDENRKLVPLLATKWTWVDNKTLDFDLRQGVKFHNGKEFDAEDLKYSYEFILDRKNGALNFRYFSFIKSVEVLSKYKARLNLKKPFPPALIYLASAASIVPKGHYDSAPTRPDGKKDFGAVKPIGTGPYMIADIKPGQYVLLKRFDAYRKDSPKGYPAIANVKFRTIKDPNTRLAELMTGAIDWIWDVPKDQAERLKGHPIVTVGKGKTVRFAYVAMDAAGRTSTKYFKDKRVRQAVAHAINRQAIVDALVGKPSEVTHSPCHPDQVGCTQDVTRYAYDPAKAKKLLAEAGYPNGFSVDFYAYREREYAEAIIGDLARVGIKAKLYFLQYSALAKKVRAGEVPFTNMTWGSSSILDVSASAGHFFTGTGDDFAQDKTVHKLIAEADGLVDPVKRAAVWKQALQRIAAEAYWVPMFTYIKYFGYSKGLDFTVPNDEIPRFYKSKWK
ncbi:MAG: ABC transporter substrate-binding protein [Hyphomicrobiaceae bacterium]|nr:ABC transporter substrate-binding protein [Hyphomicrobiaceae bacterium]